VVAVCSQSVLECEASIIPDMKRTASRILSLCTVAFALAGQAETPFPMRATDENSMRHRWTEKQVIESRLLDDCETPANWKYEGLKGEMSFTAERAKDGKQSVRLRAKTKGDAPTKDHRPWGSASVVRTVNGEDWSRWNRISVWIYPNLPGFKVVNVGVILRGEGKSSRPTTGKDYVILKNHQWNQVLSEIEYCDRSKVTGVEIQYRLQGNEADATDTVQFDMDHLDLQRVEPDKFEGWDVAPGRIAFSHVGYPVGAPKTAVASRLAAKEFKLINGATGKIVMSKPVRVEKTPLGEYQMMDFSEVREPGTYYLQAGEIKTGTFQIDDDVWAGTALKAINFFYGMRCGFAVPGAHGVCHEDWTAGPDKVQINGGWHDAGDLSQGLINTSDATYSMFCLAERLNSRKEHPELAARIIEEATWGLDWLAKTSLSNGSRVTWAVMDFWTDGKPGNVDDVHISGGSNPYETFAAASAEAIACRVLKSVDPARSARSLKLAREDWDNGMKRYSDLLKRRPVTETAAGAVVASIELFRTTGEQKYADKAVEIAPLLVDSQARIFIPGTLITGFLYDNPEKSRPMHSFSPGAREHNQIMALARLVEAFPEHPNWMKWYAALGLYSEYYLKNMAKFTEPFGMLPDGVYTDTDHLLTWETARKPMQAKIAAGTKISEHYYLRKFPLREDFGQQHLLMTMGQALGVAAQVRGDLAGAQLAERQVEWTLGRNPFSQSFMYGEGYDYHDFYNISGHIVGALPVGISSRNSGEAPYWPPNSWFAPMEVWVQPVARLLYLLREVSGPALVVGRAQTAVQFKATATGAVITVKPDADGNFRAMVPEGDYIASADGLEQHMTLLPGTTCKFDPTLDFVVVSTTGKDGRVMIELTVGGKGAHEFTIRTDNLTLKESRKEMIVQVGKKQKLVWQGQVENLNSPWFAVVVPDNNLAQRKESHGAVIPTKVKN
jgi:hypothetical protein